MKKVTEKPGGVPAAEAAPAPREVGSGGNLGARITGVEIRLGRVEAKLDHMATRERACAERSRWFRPI